MPSLLLSLSLAAHLFAADAPPIDYSTAYEECTNAVNVSPEEALAKCEGPARGGVPGAQYVMGLVLTNRGNGDDTARGIEWLEKAAAAGNPPAAYRLAVVMLNRGDEASTKRAAELERAAVCAGYPDAIEALSKGGVKKEALACPASAETDFNGTWTLYVKWDKTGPGEPKASYKVSIANGRVRVLVDDAGTWTEVKEGEFVATQTDESMTVAATDTGWDSDGKWIESWTFQLMRTGPDTAAVAYLRTVNNPHLPARFKWRTFSNFAEGTAKREKE